MVHEKRSIVVGYTGTVRNGVVVIEGGPPLAEGTRVRVLPDAPDPETASPNANVGERMLRHAGAAGPGLPADFASNHDHYLHGQPKR